MTNRPRVRVWAAAALVGGAAAAQADSLRGTTGPVLAIDVTGLVSLDGLGAPPNKVQLIDLATMAGLPPGSLVTVTSVGWDVTGDAFPPSWASEMAFYLDDNVQPDFDGPRIRPFIGIDVPGMHMSNSGGQIDLTDNGQANLVLPDGVLRLEAYEEFDDQSGQPDGVWSMGTLFIGISGGTPPMVASDNCLDAPEITGLGQFLFDNSMATTDGLPAFQCEATGSEQVQQDVWWRWTSPLTGPVHISTCGLTMVDTRIVVYGPSIGCNAGSNGVIGCNFGCDGTGGFDFYAREGERYLIRLGLGAGDPLRGQGMGGQGAILLQMGQIPLCAESDCQGLGATTLAYKSDDSTFRVADDWIAPASGRIDSLCFWGAYNVDDPTDLTDGFKVVYYEDAAGRPGRPIGAFREASIAVTSAKLAVAAKAALLATDQNNRQVFQISVCHAAVPVVDGRKYWIEVTNSAAPGPWGWARSGAATGTAWQDSTPGDSYANATAINREMSLCVGFVGDCTFDTNGDGLINFADLNAIVSNINSPCP